MVVMESRIAPGIRIVSMDEPLDFQEMVDISRELPAGKKILLGLEMFDQACDEVRAKLRACFPEMPSEAVERVLGLLVERSRCD